MSVIRTSAAGAKLATNPVTVRKRSGGRLAMPGNAAFVATAVVIELPQFGRRAVAVQPVADTAHSHDLEGRDVRKFLAQPPDVHVDGFAIAGELVTPNVFQQNIARVHATRKREQVGEQLELASGELDVAAIHNHAPRGTVDGELADDIQLRNRLRFVGVWRGTPHDGIDSSEHLTDGERLGDVVVGPELEPDDLVDLSVFCRDHDDRHPAALAERAGEVESAHAGEHEVEQDEV